MKIKSFSVIFKKFLALILVTYFSIFSPAAALAITQPVSAPVSIPVPVPVPTPTPSPIPAPTQDTGFTINISSINTTLVKGARVKVFDLTFTQNANFEFITPTDWAINGIGFAPASGGALAGTKMPVELFTGAATTIKTYSTNISIRNTGNGQKITFPVTVNVTNSTPKPDLVVEKVNVLGKHQVGGKDEVEITVKNQGNQDVNTKVGAAVYIYDPKGKKVEDFLANMEEIKASKANTRKFTMFNNYQISGQYKVLVVADPFNYIPESNKKNNEYTTNVVVSQPALINSITPTSGIVGSITAVYGSGFGNKQGSVVFYNQKGQASTGALILGWYDGGVKFRIPAVAKGTYSVEIQTSDGKKSNKVSFSVIAGQPTISSLYTYKLSWGGYFIIYGQDLGNSGKINLYNIGSTVPFYNASILYWSDSLIIGQISPKVGGNTTYGIQVSTSDNRNSSIIYRYISK